MDKNAIFNEFKKTQITQEVEVEAPVEEKEVKKDEHEIINVQAAAKKRLRNKGKRNRNNKKFKNKEVILEDKASNPFEEWKEKFLSDETNKEFMELLDYYRIKKFNIFSNEEFLKNKYEHPKMRTVVLDPTVLEENSGKGGNAYLVKPLYTDEYNYFLKNIGTREEKPEEFMKYAIKVGVLFPKFTDAILDKTGAGTILALYNYILQFSDLTKTIKILEV